MTGNRLRRIARYGCEVKYEIEIEKKLASK